jgi:hypothetical protein
MVEADGVGKSVVFRWLPTPKDTVVIPVQKTPVAAPKNVTASVGNASTVVTWGKVSNALTYQLYKVATSDSLVASIPDTSYAIGGLANGTTYKFKVVASSKDTVSPASAIVSVVPKLALPGPTTLVSVATTKAVLTWVAVPTATKYNVVQVKDNVTSTLTTTTKLTYSVTLVSGSTYQFIIYSVNGSGTGIGSNTIKVIAP